MSVMSLEEMLDMLKKDLVYLSLDKKEIKKLRAGLTDTSRR